jgi:UDP-N-acetylmuramyl pentapeptide phosphotransferase/UDP-N-acetylglucosamine-1-phosphate transferase
MFIGFMTATVPFWFEGRFPSSNPLFLVSLYFAFPLFELCNTVYRRWKNKQPVLIGDHSHIHHLLWKRFGKKKALAIYSVFLVSLSGSITLLFFTSSNPVLGCTLLLALHLALMLTILIRTGCNPWESRDAGNLKMK